VFFLQDLPVGLGELRQLQQLSLKFNPLRHPYLRLMDAKGELPLLAFLRPEGAAGGLDLEGCGFEGLPKEVWEVAGRSALVTLNLTNNRLRDLPQVRVTGNVVLLCVCKRNTGISVPCAASTPPQAIIHCLL
jgi:Leucine-rich repeat (LRR) protein